MELQDWKDRKRHPYVNKFIKTTFMEGSGSYGNMFDIVVHRDMIITSFDIHTDMECSVEVWTRTGSYMNYTRSSSGWTKIVDTNIEGQGRGVPTMIPHEDCTPVTLTSNSVQAFFITLHSSNLRYSRTSLPSGSVYSENDDLDILVGNGFYNYSFGHHFFESRIWNGQINYRVLYEANDNLVTRFDGTEKSYGNVFDVTAWNDIFVHAIDLHMDSGFQTTVEIFTINRTFIGIESENWTRLCRVNLLGNGPSHITHIPFYLFEPVYIAAGTIQSFMVSIRKPLLYFSSVGGISTGDHFVSNDDLALGAGVSLLEYPFIDKYEAGKQWNGIIRYALEPNQCQKVRSIDTRFDGNPIYLGIMFNVRAQKDLIIQSLDLSFAFGSKVEYTVFTQVGRFQDQKDFPVTHWSKIAKGSLVHDKSFIDPSIFTPVHIDAGATQAFQIKLNTGSLKLSEGNANNIYVSNNDIEIFEGMLISENGQVVINDYKIWNGSIFYYIRDRCTASSERPSLKPSIHPSSKPSNRPHTIQAPIKRPTKLKTGLLSSPPSIKKSSLPTIFSSHSPSFPPSLKMSLKPSFLPSLSPSSLPSSPPSSLPSNLPSKFHSFSPSSKQSSTPSDVYVIWSTSADGIKTQKYIDLKNSPSPTALLSLSPSSLSKVIKINCLFFVEHGPYEKEAALLNRIDQIVSSSFKTYFMDDMKDIKLISVKTYVTSDFGFHRCKTQNKGFLCTSLSTDIITTKDSEEPEETSRYFLYKHAKSVVSSLPFPSVTYTGIEPVMMGTLVQVTVSDSKQMEETDVVYYESTVKNFLQQQVVAVNITSVTVNNSLVELIDGRRRLNEIIDFNTAIFGEYIPPPYIDFETQVQDSFVIHSDEFIDKLKDGSSLFQKNYKSCFSFCHSSYFRRRNTSPS